MPGKSASALATESLNALIAGGHFPDKLIRLTAKGHRVDTDALRAIEEQLRDYYAQAAQTAVKEPA